MPSSGFYRLVLLKKKEVKSTINWTTINLPIAKNIIIHQRFIQNNKQIDIEFESCLLI